MEKFLLFLALGLGALAYVPLRISIECCVHLAHGPKPYRYPSGRWMLADQHKRQDQLTLCIMAPAFLILAGVVVWIFFFLL